MSFLRRNGYRVICMAGLVLGQAGFAAGVAPAASGLSNAVEQAWRLDPQAAALDARDAEARAAQELAAGLTPEPGSLTIGSRNDRLNSNLGEQEYELELATPLWLPGQKAARVAEAASLIDHAAAKRAALRLELAGNVRQAWWAVAAGRNASALAANRLDTARALETGVRRRYKAGEVSRIDANLAQTEMRAAEADLIDAEAALLQAEQAFRTLTGAAAPANMEQELPATRRSLSEAPGSPASHPQLAAATAAARSARARVNVVEKSRRSAPELALRVVRDRTSFAEPLNNSIGIRLKIPFSSGAQGRRESSAALAEADQAEAEMQRVQTRVRLEVERAQRGLLTAERQLAMAQERRELAAENLRLTEKAYALGESDLATLLHMRAAAYDAESLLAQQRVARAAAISNLNQALGVLP